MLNIHSEEEIYSLLRIPIRLRTPKHIQTLMSITESVTFFHKIYQEYNSAVIHEKCCETMTLEEYSESDIIINFGEVGDKFYIIFKGSVSVMVPTTERIKVKASEAELYKNPDPDSESSENSSSEDLDTFILPNKREKREGIPVASVSEIIKSLQKERKSLRKKNEYEEHSVAKLFSDKFKQEKKEIVKIVKECDNEYIEIEVSKLEVVNILKEGACFGELALMSDRPRAATITANSRVSLLVIHKNQFQKILGNIANDRLSSKVKFLHSLPFFSSWTKSAISKISVYFEEVTFLRNQVIFAEGQEVKELYFIREGEILITKQQKVSSSNSIILKNQKVILKNKELRLYLKGKGEIAGGYEILNNLSYRVYGCVCNSTVAEVYVIRKDNLLNRIPHLELIKEVIVAENQRLEDRLKSVTAQINLNSNEKQRDECSRSQLRSKDSENYFSPDKTIFRTFYNSNNKNSPPRVHKERSRVITKAEIFRALNPKSMKVEVKPKAIRYFQVRKTPPPNFMLRSRGDSRWNIANKRVVYNSPKEMESSITYH